MVNTFVCRRSKAWNDKEEDQSDFFGSLASTYVTVFDSKLLVENFSNKKDTH